MADKFTDEQIQALLKLVEKKDDKETDEQRKERERREDADRIKREEEEKALGDAGRRALERVREERDAAKDEARKHAADLKKIKDEQDERDRKAAEESGNFKKLYEDLKGKHEELEQGVKDRDLTALKQKVAKDTGLPDELVERLAGASEADLKADAEKLLKSVAPTKAADTDTGRDQRTNGVGGSSNSSTQDTKVNTNYSFVPAGAVTIPD